MAVAIGSDGTAVLAWAVEEDTTMRDNCTYADCVWVSLRPSGGEFTPVAAVPTDGGSEYVAAQVRPDGVAEIAFDGGTASGGTYPTASIFHLELRAGAPIGEPVRVTDVDGELMQIRLLAGGPGEERLLITDESAVVAFVRTGERTWGSRQVLARVGEASGTPMADLPDGDAIVAYSRGSAVMVRRAARGSAFGTEERVGRVTRGWLDYGYSVATSGRGDALVSWVESSDDERFRFENVCAESCHDRVMAAVSGPDGRFGPVHRVSPLGTVRTDVPTVAAVSDRGERLLASQDAVFGVHGQDALVVARGDAARDRPTRRDHRAPRVAVRISQAAARAAAVGEPLRARVGCDEACAVRVIALSTNDDDMLDLDDLQIVVRRRAGTTDASWRLSRQQRDRLKRILRFGSVWIIARATDGAGDLSANEARLR